MQRIKHSRQKSLDENTEPTLVMMGDKIIPEMHYQAKETRDFESQVAKYRVDGLNFLTGATQHD